MRLLKQAVKDLISVFRVKVTRACFPSEGERFGTILILMYHKINSERDVLGLSVSPSFFDQQLSFLKTHCRVISLSESISLLSEGRWEDTYVVLTFDDGYRDNYDYAFPLLKKHQVPATIFVTIDGLQTGKFGWSSFDQAILKSDHEVLGLDAFGLGDIDIRTRVKKEKVILSLHKELKQCAQEAREAIMSYVVNELSDGESCERIMLNWDEVREMQKSGLVSIGSHTLTHPILTRVDPVRALHEVAQSKMVIEKELGTKVDCFAYPNGTAVDFNDQIIKLLKKSGYASACTTEHGFAVRGVDLYRLPRVDVTFGMCEGVGGRFSPEMFEVNTVGKI